MLENLPEYYRKSDGAKRKSERKGEGERGRIKSARVRMRKKIESFRPSYIALTLTLFLYPEPAGCRAGG